MEFLKKFIILAAIFVLVSEVVLVIYHYQLSTNIKPKTNPPQKTTTTQVSPSYSNPSSTSQGTATAAKYYYPISSYDSRLTFRYYGLYVTPEQQAEPCGAAFTGYHDGDDLETTAAEQGIAVPVYAIADGVVKELNYVQGYGGLLVLGTMMNSQNYTIYYGHIDLASATVANGEAVTAGEKLADLGAACSTQTDGERKHLHFAIHKGTTIDVRGYVPDVTTLANWVDPKVFLANLGAQSK